MKKKRQQIQQQVNGDRKSKHCSPIWKTSNLHEQFVGSFKCYSIHTVPHAHTTVSSWPQSLRGLRWLTRIRPLQLQSLQTI